MTRTDRINRLRAGHPMTHRVSRIIADMLEADGTALASAEESHLLRTLADIREALGVGAKPMLDELPGLIRAMLAERDELARALVRHAGWRETFCIASVTHYCTECRARAIELDDDTLDGDHAPGCPVGLAEEILKTEGK